MWIATFSREWERTHTENTMTTKKWWKKKWFRRRALHNRKAHVNFFYLFFWLSSAMWQRASECKKQTRKCECQVLSASNASSNAKNKFSTMHTHTHRRWGKLLFSFAYFCQLNIACEIEISCRDFTIVSAAELKENLFIINCKLIASLTLWARSVLYGCAEQKMFFAAGILGNLWEKFLILNKWVCVCVNEVCMNMLVTKLKLIWENYLRIIQKLCNLISDNFWEFFILLILSHVFCLFIYL